MVQQSSAIGIFCCYAQEDISHMKKLKTHLSPFQRQDMIHVWHSGDIRAGTEWNQEIKKYLNEAKVILLLISADFIASEYCYRTEMKHALERHKQGETKVIPVILRPVTGWEEVPFGDIQLGQLQALPTDAKAVTTWTDCDSVWKDVAEGIGRVANELLRNPSISQSSMHNQQVVEALAQFSQERDTKDPLSGIGDQKKNKVIDAGQPLSSQPKEMNAVSTRHSEGAEPVFDESSIEQLTNALLSAFPTQRDLKLLISFKLMKNMEIIAAGNNLEEQVHSLVTWAYSQGQMKALITGALARNPGNPKLCKVAMEHGF